MKYSMDDILKFLSLSNLKLKKMKRNIKNVRIERNYYKLKLQKIEDVLNNTTYYFGKYDFPSEREHYRLIGKLDLKEELKRIIADVD